MVGPASGGAAFVSVLILRLCGRRLSTRAAVLITHAEVDPDHPEFASSTKPIGSRMTAEVAHQRASRELAGT
jgi:carbamate kinase